MKKKVKRPAGYKITDRNCILCKKDVPIDKDLHKHHTAYKERGVEIKGSTHGHTCHDIFHFRLKYRNEFEKKYGKDFGGYFAARAIIEAYKSAMPLIQKFYPEEFL